jgi:hypothetical protein
MAREDGAYGFTCGVYTIPATGASARLIEPVPGEVRGYIKYFGGGSCEIIGTPGPGLTAAPTLGTGYLLGAGEVVPINGPARYYLAATTASATVYFRKELSQGYLIERLVSGL